MDPTLDAYSILNGSTADTALELNPLTSSLNSFSPALNTTPTVTTSTGSDGSLISTLENAGSSLLSGVENLFTASTTAALNQAQTAALNQAQTAAANPTAATQAASNSSKFILLIGAVIFLIAVV